LENRFGFGHIARPFNLTTDKEKAKVRRRYPIALLLLTLFSTCLAANGSILNRRYIEELGQQDLSKSSEAFNINGDVTLSPEQNRATWNPHSTGLTNLSQWKVTFENETEISLKTSANEAGHVATGAWWTTSFKTKEKLSIYASKPVQIMSSFRIKIVEIDCEKGNEWLRIALACAVQRIDGSIVYTELDVWDSPTALSNPNGDVAVGGNVVYRGGDVVEYKIDQATIGAWKGYSVNIANYINSAWTIKAGDALESVYIVVEVSGGVSVAVKADDLWLMNLG
jgi:hypothetical protein